MSARNEFSPIWFISEAMWTNLNLENHSTKIDATFVDFYYLHNKITAQINFIECNIFDDANVMSWSSSS